MEGWRALVVIMAGVAGKHPQTAYSVMQNSLQKEWDFVQSVAPDIGTTFHSVEDVLCGAFLPAIFKGATSQILVRAVIGLPVNQDRIALPDPTQTVRSNWMVSGVIT